MFKKRCIIEFWAEKGNCLKRSRVTVRLNDKDVPVWNCPKKYVNLFNETAVYIFYKNDWLLGMAYDPRRNREVHFLPVAPWEFERDYFTGILLYSETYLKIQTERKRAARRIKCWGSVANATANKERSDAMSVKRSV